MRHQSEIRQYNGFPTLFIDGEPVSPMAFDFMSSAPDITNNIPIPPAMDSDIQLRALHGAGVKLYFIRTEMRNPAELDSVVDKLRRTIVMLRECAPDAYAIPWLIISPYEGFADKYPHDLQTFDDGSVGGYNSVISGRMRSAETPRHTHASLAWRHETAGVLRQLVRRINADALMSDVVVGYFFFPLHHESCYFYDFDHDKKLDDYGPATRMAMRNYLAEMYAGDVEALRRAWGDDTVTFENAPLPDRRSREQGSAGMFWDPAKDRQVLDYALIRSRVWADTLEYFAQACKEEMHYKGVVGAFYGYLLHNDTLWGGQGYFRNVMDCPYIDFWAGPFHYNNKGPGMSVTLRQPVRSLQKHGKLLFAEIDTTHTSSTWHERNRQGLIYTDATRDKELLKRDFMLAAIGGINGWWCDFGAGLGLYDEQDMLPTVRQIQRVGRESLHKPRGSVAEVATVLQQEGFLCTPNTYGLTKTAIEQSRLYETYYLGAPVDDYELQDVLDGSLPHRVILFQNAYRLTAEERDAVRALRRADRMLVFMYAQGYLSDDAPTAHVDNVTDLTGIRLKEIGGGSGRMVLTEAAAAWGLTPGDELGECDKMITTGMDFYRNKHVPFEPQRIRYESRFAIDDPDAIVLGVYKDSGEPAFAVKDVDGCMCVYVGSALLNTAPLRALCRKAGVHLYTDEDNVIYANESYVGIHAVKDGPVTLHLSGKKRVQEAFDGQEYAVENGDLTLELKQGDTRLFTYPDT